MVTENTIEEKIVERAQQKLKLDAMVVQSNSETNYQGFAFILKLT
jgi:SWI/SNF-related matrix-associated actin-dependent regulator of chromatin subfamily A member 5